jgi:GNAT superfamily N-acetyltransferase
MRLWGGQDVGQETDMAATDGHENRAPDQQEIGLSQRGVSPKERRPIASGAHNRCAIFGEFLGVHVMPQSESRHNAIRYAVCRLEGIEWAEWGQFFSHLAPSDIRDRFGRLVSVEAGLRLLTLPNHYGSVMFGAFCPEGLVGVANLAKDAMGRAEIAVLVRSDWKRRGIGETLMRAALCEANREGLPVYGFVQPSNSAIIALMRRLGFVYSRGQVDNIIMYWHPAEMQPSEDVGAGAGRQGQGHPPAPFGELILRTATL